MEKHYKILGLETTSTLEEIEKRFNVLYKEYNPEKQEGDLKEFFKSEQEKVKEAYKEICLHLIREKEKEEEQTTIEDKVVEEVTEEKVIEEEEEEYRRTIHNNDVDESDLEITNRGKEGLDKMVYWSKFLSVVGYILLGLLTILAFKLFGEYVDEPERIRSSYGYDGRIIYRQNWEKDDLFDSLIRLIIFIIICFFPVRYLYRFSSKTRMSLDYNDEKALGEGLENLGSFFKFYGVIMILFLIWLIYYLEKYNVFV